MNKKFVVHARVLKAMSDENRLRILDLLREREYNASELLDEMRKRWIPDIYSIMQ